MKFYLAPFHPYEFNILIKESKSKKRIWGLSRLRHDNIFKFSQLNSLELKRSNNPNTILVRYITIPKG